MKTSRVGKDVVTGIISDNLYITIITSHVTLNLESVNFMLRLNSCLGFKPKILEKVIELFFCDCDMNVNVGTTTT